MWMSLLPIIASAEEDQFSTALNSFFSDWQLFISGFMGVAILSSVLIFIIHMIKLATSGGSHPMIRRKIMGDILVSGVTTALLGGISLVFYLLYTIVN